MDATEAPRRSGGRSSRLARRTGHASPHPPPQIKRQIPTYDLLDEEALVRIEAQSDWILKEIGIDIRGDDEALDLFKDAGASIDGERVRFDPGLPRSLCKTAPSEFQMCGRQPGRSINLGGKSLVLMPAYGPPFVTDLDKGRRYATLHDFENFVKLAYATPHLNHSGGTVCEPVDIPVNKRHLDMVYAHLRYSTKPFMGAVTSPDRAEDSIEMARIVYGSEFLESNCVIQGNINVNSPLVFDHIMTGALKAYARANQSVVVSPFILGGAMGPVTQPALLAQAHAEAMVGIALGQLVRPGSPAVYGNFLTTMNLKSGAPTFGTPEANLSTFAIGQLCRRLNLPLRSGGQLTASKTADGQAMQESSNSMLTGLLGGSNFIFHAAGWLEGGLTMGYEKFVMDLDHCSMMIHMANGLTINEESLASDAFQEVAPGENFLGCVHTMKHIESANHMSSLADVSSFEQWSENGALDTQQRANLVWKKMLEQYEEPDMEPGIHDELQEFIERKKRATPDAWH